MPAYSALVNGAEVARPRKQLAKVTMGPGVRRDDVLTKLPAYFAGSSTDT
jgi:hypothetical protein